MSGMLIIGDDQVETARGEGFEGLEAVPGLYCKETSRLLEGDPHHRTYGLGILDDKDVLHFLSF
jgi:hypothetical protein